MTTLTCALMLLCAGAAACGPVMDDRQLDRSHRVRAYLDAVITAGKTPGIQYFVVDSAGIVFEYDGGWADLRQRVPMSPRTTRTSSAHPPRSSATRRELCSTAQQRTTGGRPVAMTLGWHIGDLAGRRYFYKEGGGGGFHAMMRVYPAAGVATVLMVNATGFNVRRGLNTLDREFLR